MICLRNFAVGLGCFFLASPAFAEVLSQYRFRSSDSVTLDAVATKYEIISRDGDQFEIIVPRAQADEFLHFVPHAELQKEDLRDDLQSVDGLFGPAGYRDLKAVNESLYALAAKYPSLVRVEQYGSTESGFPLLLLKISDNVGVDEGEPKVELDAGTHGDEIIGVEAVLQLVEELLGKYGTDARLTSIVNNLDLTFIPVVNPEGYSRQERYSGNVDPNRDYPFPEGPEKKSVACIAALRDLFSKNSFVGSLTVHAYGSLVMYPWGYTKEPISDVSKRKEMDDLAALMSQQNGYKHGPIATTIYVAKGSSSDYYYWKHKTVAMAVEIGSSKAPKATGIPKVVSEVRETVWTFLEHFAQK
jgi:hypothetical protein